MPWVGFEPTIPAFERTKTVHAWLTTVYSSINYKDLRIITVVVFQRIDMSVEQYTLVTDLYVCVFMWCVPERDSRCWDSKMKSSGSKDRALSATVSFSIDLVGLNYAREASKVPSNKSGMQVTKAWCLLRSNSVGLRNPGVGARVAIFGKKVRNRY
jgi:hypothetical protein